MCVTVATISQRSSHPDTERVIVLQKQQTLDEKVQTDSTYSKTPFKYCVLLLQKHALTTPPKEVWGDY